MQVWPPDRRRQLLNILWPAPEPEVMEFTLPAHRARFERLAKLKFGQTRIPDVGSLRKVQLADDMADEVEKLLLVGSWHKLLNIHDPAIRSLTLEVLASFVVDRSYAHFDSVGAIQFRAFGQHHSMSVTQFSTRLGLYDEEYTKTEEYESL